MQEVIEFKNVTKIYKLFKNDKKRFASLFFKNIKVKEKRAVDNAVSYTHLTLPTILLV